MAKTTAVERLEAGRLREWAHRCRELSDLTAVPDVNRELLALAEEMEDAAETPSVDDANRYP
jgi:hypothetical protein